MKDHDNTTNVLCYCKDNVTAKRLLVKEENKEIQRDIIANTMNIDKSKPWSVFGEWYWI